MEIKVGDVWKRKYYEGSNLEERSIKAVHGLNVAFAVNPDDNILRVCPNQSICVNFILIERDCVKRPGENEWATLKKIVDFGIATEEDARRRWLDLHDDGEVAHIGAGARWRAWHSDGYEGDPPCDEELTEYRLKLDSRGMMPEVPKNEESNRVQGLKGCREYCSPTCDCNASDTDLIERQRKSAERIITQGGSCNGIPCEDCLGFRKNICVIASGDDKRTQFFTDWIAANPKPEPQLMICENAELACDFIYLASPYSHELPAIREGRYRAVCKHAAKMMQDGKHVFSPIAHSHSIALFGDLPIDFEYWRDYDYEMLKNCSSVVVLMIDGWEESIGVKEEIKIANRLSIPVYFERPVE